MASLENIENFSNSLSFLLILTHCMISISRGSCVQISYELLLANEELLLANEELLLANEKLLLANFSRTYQISRVQTQV